MKISIRMDDITPDMDWAKFLRFKALCDQYAVRPLIGVVPDNRDPNLHINAPGTAPVSDFWQYVRQLQQDGWCVAQHGVTHCYTTSRMGCFPLNHFSEFAGMPYREQYEALKRGKSIFLDHGITTDLFMAPAHSFDRNTIKALQKLGFRRMTDGFGKHPYIRWGMIFYPISYRQSSALRDRKVEGYTTFVVHTNTMGDDDFERYERICAAHRDQFVSYAELLQLEPERRSVFGSLKEYGMAVAKSVLVEIRSRI